MRFVIALGALADSRAPFCSLLEFGAVGDNMTDNTAAFRRATASCAEVLVPSGGIFLTAPFNLSSHSVLRVEGTISGSQRPEAYPIVTQLPRDEAYRAPWMRNRQYSALVAAYSAENVSIVGGGTIDGNGWPWWRNVSHCVGGYTSTGACPGGKANASNTHFHQRPKLVELVDSTDVTVAGSPAAPLRLRNSPFWTLHPIFCTGVRIRDVVVTAPRCSGCGRACSPCTSPSCLAGTTATRMESTPTLARMCKLPIR